MEHSERVQWPGVKDSQLPYCSVSTASPHLLTRTYGSPLLLAGLQIRRHSQFCHLTNYAALAEVEEMRAEPGDKDSKPTFCSFPDCYCSSGGWEPDTGGAVLSQGLPRPTGAQSSAKRMTGKCRSNPNVEVLILLTCSVLFKIQNALICLVCVKVWGEKNVFKWIKAKGQPN